jgi:hypothetical protein
MSFQPRIWCLIVVSVTVLVMRAKGEGLEHTDAKSKSSTPNLLYFISTLPYIDGTSFRVTSSKCRSVNDSIVSAVLPSVSLLDDCTARDCSLKNLGADNESVVRSECRLDSAWFRRLVRGFFAKKPISALVILAMMVASIFGDGAPTS